VYVGIIPSANPKTMPMNPISTAILSYGMSGRVFHAPLLTVHPGFQLQKIWRRPRPQGRDNSDIQTTYPQVQIVERLEDILGDPQIELVVVNTPEPTHYTFVHAALSAGKHVVVEKAFTPTVAEADALIALADVNGLMLSVYHNRRWDSDFLTIQKILADGYLGEILEYEAHYDRFRPEIKSSWKEVVQPGTGILYNLGSHLIDQALVLFGLPQTVFADIRRQREGVTVPDQFDLLLGYPHRKALLRASYLARIPEPRYRLRGRLGSFRKYGIDPQEAALAKGKLPHAPDWGQEPEQDWGTLACSLNGLEFEGRITSLPGNYPAFYEGIYQAIRNGQPLPVAAQEARNVIAVIEAAIESSEKGQVVKMG